MKFKSIFFIALCALAQSRTNACPTCASSLDDYSPPFFSEKYQAYANNDNNNDSDDEGDGYEENNSDTDNDNGNY